MEGLRIRIGYHNRAGMTVPAGLMARLGSTQEDCFVKVQRSGHWLQVSPSKPSKHRGGGIHKIGVRTFQGKLFGYVQIRLSQLEISAVKGTEIRNPEVSVDRCGEHSFMVRIPASWCRETADQIRAVSPHQDIRGAGRAGAACDPEIAILQEAVALINNAIKGGAEVKLRKGHLILIARVTIG